MLQQTAFRNREDIIIIVVDWKEKFIVNKPHYDYDDSYHATKKKMDERKDELSAILEKNMSVSE